MLVKFIHAVHGDSMDTDKGPVYAGRAGGFLISVKGGPSIYHTGDTDLFGDMALLSGKVDMMLLCIGDKFTMGPVDAAQAVKLVKPMMAVPMHFGTFPALTGTAEQFPGRAAENRAGETAAADEGRRDAGMAMKPTIVFVYNADSGLFNTLTDIAHKIFAPQTYECNLCAITYGNFGMRDEWQEFLASVDAELEFLHRDELAARYGITAAALPAVFRKEGEQPHPVDYCRRDQCL